ncbi:hypothetical protein F0344_35160 (plasmid) [Streptomyces finlayi]|uniref:N-formylglutamate amidohydrolase n=1 Tax=Streptomyces finlayi TaxID=67296 RepID=A0A7G7BWH4_9ACTN|nr:hypothetical protein [Streptomyces finlayi]QNE79689.1 hypothetical protein F0344_35160 [Streptomyces finlayi]
MLLALVGCQADTATTQEDSVPRARELVDLRSRILGYTATFRADSPYTPPGKSQRARLAKAVGSLLSGDAQEAERQLAPLGLGFTRLTDTDSGRRYDEIAATGTGESTRWGRLYLNADSTVRWNAQVPHPVSDRETEALGIRLLEQNPGGALVLAGAHRRAGEDDAADVAHREDSAFHTVVVELQKRGVPGVQLHGFTRSSDRPYDAVVSTGTVETAPAEVAAMADRMDDDGLRVCRAWAARCPLEGTTNVQGRSAQREHAGFVHVELARHARADDGRDTEEAADALAGLVTAWRSSSPSWG